MSTQTPDDRRSPEAPNERHGMLMWAGLAGVLAVAALTVFAYSQHQRSQVDELASTNRTLNASLTQMQEQLQSVTDRLNKRIEAENAARTAAATAPAPAPRAVARKAVAVQAPPRRDPRVDKLQNDLSEQQKALASTRDDLDRTRTDLQGQLDSSKDELNGNIGRTRDELNTSIAHTHDELVTLQKQGAKNYFEFSLNKSKQFQKVGPVSLELNKVDYKHKSYDLSMLVDDFNLQKKKINLYEPVWINLVDSPEPVQLIVNQIDKDKITGYIAAPKYRKSELNASVSTPTTTSTQLTPAVQ